MGKALSATAGDRQKLALHPLFLPTGTEHRGPSVVWAQGARSIQKKCPPRTRGARGCARWRTSASGDRCVARGPLALGSEQPIARTLRTTSPHLFPPLAQLPDMPVSHHWESLQLWLGLPTRTEFNPFLPRPRVPPEAVRAGHPSASCRRCCVRSPRPPSWGYRLMKRSFSSVICFVFLQSSDK